MDCTSCESYRHTRAVLLARRCIPYRWLLSQDTIRTNDGSVEITLVIRGKGFGFALHCRGDPFLNATAINACARRLSSALTDLDELSCVNAPARQRRAVCDKVAVVLPNEDGCCQFVAAFASTFPRGTALVLARETSNTMRRFGHQFCPAALPPLDQPPRKKEPSWWKPLCAAAVVAVAAWLAWKKCPRHRGLARR